jgi:nanoRNase/pAp phosphatase (c-di-AMP/oligoRNAs hydrolase)
MGFSERILDILSDPNIAYILMMLGIYEDTGSLTFSSTTAEDFSAAAYLLAQGASLAIISDMITRELSAEQIFLLNDLISSAERYDIRGVEVVIIARHGKNHSIFPSKVNFRANIWALKEEGCTHILASTAVGSLREEIEPGHLVFPNQFIDHTKKES